MRGLRRIFEAFYPCFSSWPASFSLLGPNIGLDMGLELGKEPEARNNGLTSSRVLPDSTQFNR
jgi:hypothetical protein